jgi:ankyrin repeat protein
MPTRAELSQIAEAMDGHTPLMRAALEADTNTVKSLLSTRANVNASDNRGRTALMFAVINR